MGFEISNFQYQYLTKITQYILFFVIHITEFCPFQYEITQTLGNHENSHISLKEKIDSAKLNE